MTVKHLIQHGNSLALVIDKSILREAGCDENTFFQIVVDPHTGITIQSVKPIKEKAFQDSLSRVVNKYDKMFKKLSKR